MGRRLCGFFKPSISFTHPTFRWLTWGVYNNKFNRTIFLFTKKNINSYSNLLSQEIIPVLWKNRLLEFFYPLYKFKNTTNQFKQLSIEKRAFYWDV